MPAGLYRGFRCRILHSGTMEGPRHARRRFRYDNSFSLVLRGPRRDPRYQGRRTTSHTLAIILSYRFLYCRIACRGFDLY